MSNTTGNEMSAYWVTDDLTEDEYLNLDYRDANSVLWSKGIGSVECERRNVCAAYFQGAYLGTWASKHAAKMAVRGALQRALQVLALAVLVLTPTLANATPTRAAYCEAAVQHGVRLRVAKPIGPTPFLYRTISGATCKAVFEIARDGAVDPALVLSIAVQESNLDPSAIGADGEAGPLQSYPRFCQERIGGPCETFEHFTASGVSYLASLLQRFDGNTIRALQAYRCGPDGYGEHCTEYALNVSTRAARIRRSTR